MFNLDDRLAADTVLITDFDLCQVRLMKDAHYPWLILVPKRADIREIHQLEPQDQQCLMQEITHVSRVLETAFKPDKINVAALGNMVPQLHVHIIARFSADPAWPGPVWGAVPPAAYKDGDLDVWVEGLKQILG